MALTRLFLPAVAAAFALSAGAAVAQSGPPLSSMPMPPSAGDPPPADPKAKPPASRKGTTRAKAGEDGAATPAPKPKRTGNAAANTTYERPSRYVPEGFEEDTGGGSSRARPFMSESGRPGMGMRF